MMRWAGRAWALLAATLALAACVPPQTASGPAGMPVPLAGGASGPATGQFRPVALLAPLSGPNAARGEALQNAAKLAMDGPGAPPLDVRDTGGTPEGAASAARQAIAAGAAIIIGPLTAGETTAAASVAQPAGIPILAFTTDPSVARPGVWVLGITPDQQVRRLVAASLAAQKTRLAALLPTDAFGNAMGAALRDALAAASAAPADIKTYNGSLAGIPAAVRALASDAGRSGTLTVSTPAADQPGTAQPPPPAQFDAILLADLGDKLATISSLLAGYQLTPPAIGLLGPALWSSAAARRGATLDGAWYAAPPVEQRSGFDAKYTAAYGSSAPGLADFAYDAASLARALAPSGYAAATLTRADGFAGVDGLFALLPDGRVRRALAIFEIHGDGAQMVQPPPASLAVPGS